MAGLSEIRDLLRRLSPVISEREAEKLWVMFSQGSWKTRGYVERRVRWLARKHLNETFRRGILLPPPDRNPFTGPLEIGNIIYNDKIYGRMGLYPDELAHTCVLGATGVGKTTIAYALAAVLLREGQRCYVIDPKRSWRSLGRLVPPSRTRIFTLGRDVAPFFMNFLIPPRGVDVKQFYDTSVHLMCELMYSGLGAYEIVTEALDELKMDYPWPESERNHFTMREFASRVIEISRRKKIRREGEWSATAMRATKQLARSLDFINVRQNAMENSLEEAQLAIFEAEYLAAGLWQGYAYITYSLIFREWMKRLSTPERDRNALTIIFDDAAHLMGAPYPTPVWNNIISTCRELGISLVFISQAASEVSKTALSNARNLIVGRQVNAEDIRRVTAAMGFESAAEDKKFLVELRTGEFIVRAGDQWPHPVLVRSRPIVKEYISDDEIRAMAEKWLRELGAPLAELVKIEAEPMRMMEFQSGDKGAQGGQGIPARWVSESAGIQGGHGDRVAVASADEGGTGLPVRSEGLSARNASALARQSAGAPEKESGALGGPSRPSAPREHGGLGEPRNLGCEPSALEEGSRGAPGGLGEPNRHGGLGVPVIQSGPGEPVDQRGQSRPAGLMIAEDPDNRGVPGNLAGGRPGSVSIPVFTAATGAPASEAILASLRTKPERVKANMAHLLDQAIQHAGKQLTFIYMHAGIPKATASRTKDDLLECGLAQVRQQVVEGRAIKVLQPTEAGKKWLAENHALLARPVEKMETRRFGGETSHELEQIFRAHLNQRTDVTKIVKEADDLEGGKHDLLITFKNGEQLVAEMISGQSKISESFHAIRARNAGRRYLGLCLHNGIRERMRRYFREAGIVEDGVNVRLLVPADLFGGKI